MVNYFLLVLIPSSYGVCLPHRMILYTCFIHTWIIKNVSLIYNLLCIQGLVDSAVVVLPFAEREIRNSLNVLLTNINKAGEFPRQVFALVDEALMGWVFLFKKNLSSVSLPWYAACVCCVCVHASVSICVCVGVRVCTCVSVCVRVCVCMHSCCMREIWTRCTCKKCVSA